MAAAYILSEKKVYSIFVAVLTLISALIWAGSEFVQNIGNVLNPIQYFLMAIVYAITFFVVFSRVLRRGSVTSEKLQSAVCGYLLIAFCWSMLYALVEHFEPGTFPVITGDVDGVMDINDFLYISFTALTSTGYGEIVAVSSEGRSLQILEQIIGVFYIAVIIARLAGAYPPEEKASSPTRPLRMTSIAFSMLPCAVISTAGIWGCRSRICPSSAMPSSGLHMPVRNHQANGLGIKNIERVIAVFGGQHRAVERGQRILDRIAHQRIVVNNKNRGRRHDLPSDAPVIGSRIVKAAAEIRGM